MNHKLIRIAPKILTGILLFLAFFGAWRRGDFKRGKFQPGPFPKPCLWLLISFPILAAFLLPLDGFLHRVILSVAGRSFFAPLEKFGSLISDNINFWLYLLGIYYLLRLAKQPAWAKRFLAAVLAAGLAGLACHGLKFIFLRARPYTGLSPFSFFNWEKFAGDPKAFQSFPSGDVAIVSGAAGYFFYAFPNRPLRWLILLLPLCTAFARVSLNRHWVSDTAASLWLGFIISRGVWNYFRTDS